MKAMKALEVAPQPFFTWRGTPFSVYFRTLVMAEQGVEIDVLTYGEGADPDIPGARVVRIPHPRFLRPVPVGPSLKKAVLDVILAFHMVWLLLRNRYDIVHAHEEAVFIALVLRPFFRYRLIYDMHSSLPQQLTNFEFTRSRLLIGLFRRLEDAVLRRADAVITISPALAEHALSLMPDPSRHFLIENSVLDEVRLVSGNGATPPGGGKAGGDPDAGITLPEGRRIVAYTGTFERYQGLDLLLDAFPAVLERVPEAFLTMVGGSPDQVEAYRARATALGLNGHCLIAERVPQPVARRCLERADVVVSPRSEGTNTPLKIYEHLAVGVPLVATRILSHTQVLDEEVCFLVDPRPEDIAEGLAAALLDGERRERKRDAARALYAEKYSRPIYEGKIRSLLELVGGNRA